MVTPVEYKENQETPISLYSSLLFSIFGNSIKKVQWYNNSLIVTIDSSFFFTFIYFLKMNSMFKISQLVEIVCIDTLQKDRFLLRYEFLSLFNSMRIVVLCNVAELSGVVSLSSLFYNATWLEREVWDMFGVFFFNKDLRRILTDYGFEGHPLRKDFPLSGFVELFYDESSNLLKYYPISLAQEYRDFKFLNPWKKM